MNMEEVKPSKLTKVLVHKIHGGRKKDSKFWNPENDLSNDELGSIGIEKNSKNKSTYRRPIKTENTIFAVIWRFLLICLIFDGGIYCYFHFIEKTTVSEGIKQIRRNIYGSGNEIANVPPRYDSLPAISSIPPPLRTPTQNKLSTSSNKAPS